MAALLTAETSDYSQGMVVASQSVVSEEALWIRRAQKSDSRAFEHLYRMHIDKVYGLCLRMTGNVAEAEYLSELETLPCCTMRECDDGKIAKSAYQCRQ